MVNKPSVLLCVARMDQAYMLKNKVPAVSPNTYEDYVIACSLVAGAMSLKSVTVGAALLSLYSFVWFLEKKCRQKSKF